MLFSLDGDISWANHELPASQCRWSPFSPSSTHMGVGPLNISPLPAGAVLNLVRRGCRRAGFCLPGQVDVPGPSALRAGSFSRALHGEEGSSSTHGSSLPCTPEHVGDFVAQPFPMTSFPWHPLGQISNRCDQSNGASTSLSPIQQTTASAPQQDLGLRLVIVVGGVGVGVG